MPLLVSVRPCGLEVVATVCPAKLSDAGDNDTPGTGSGSPVPVSGRLCGEPGALLAIVSDPLAGPTNAGAKVKSTGQFCAGARLAGQPDVWLNGPVAPKAPEKSSAAAPVLVIVARWAPETVLIVTAPKSSEAGERPTPGAGAGVTSSTALAAAAFATADVPTKPVTAPAAMVFV